MFSLVKSISFLGLVSLAPFANAELPQVLLGRGMMAKIDQCTEMKQENREWRRLAKAHDKNLIYSPLYSEEELTSTCSPRKIDREFLGFECVAEDSSGVKSCSQVQAVWINMDEMRVIQKGFVLRLSDSEHPSQAEIRSFLRTVHSGLSDYLDSHQTKGQKVIQVTLQGFAAAMFVGGVTLVTAATGGTGGAAVLGCLAVSGVTYLGVGSLINYNAGFVRRFELIDANQFNWSSDPHRIQPRLFNIFRDFLMSYSNGRV